MEHRQPSDQTPTDTDRLAVITQKIDAFIANCNQRTVAVFSADGSYEMTQGYRTADAVADFNLPSSIAGDEQAHAANGLAILAAHKELGKALFWFATVLIERQDEQVTISEHLGLPTYHEVIHRHGNTLRTADFPAIVGNSIQLEGLDHGRAASVHNVVTNDGLIRRKLACLSIDGIFREAHVSRKPANDDLPNRCYAMLASDIWIRRLLKGKYESASELDGVLAHLRSNNKELAATPQGLRLFEDLRQRAVSIKKGQQLAAKVGVPNVDNDQYDYFESMLSAR